MSLKRWFIFCVLVVCEQCVALSLEGGIVKAAKYALLMKGSVTERERERGREREREKGEVM